MFLALKVSFFVFSFSRALPYLCRRRSWETVFPRDGWQIVFVLAWCGSGWIVPDTDFCVSSVIYCLVNLRLCHIKYGDHAIVTIPSKRQTKSRTYYKRAKNKTPRPGSLVFGKRGGFCWCKGTAFIRIDQTFFKESYFTWSKNTYSDLFCNL